MRKNAEAVKCMSTNDLALVLAVVSTTAAVIQTVVIVVSLLYVRSSIVQSNKQNQLNTLMAASSFYRKFNELELADPNLAALMGDSKEDVVASIVLIDFEARKAIHDRAPLDDPF